MSSTTEEKQTKQKKSFWKRLPVILILSMWAGFLCLVLFLNIYVSAVTEDWNGWFGGMPSIEDLQNPKSEEASEMYSSDGKLLGKYFRSNRTPLDYSEISPVMLDALIATEDVRYEEHAGIDMKGVFAIFYYQLKGKKRGSSTITQQLAKNLFKTDSYGGSLAKKNRTLGRVIAKSKEWVLSYHLERMYSKDEIIAMYLNTVDFGSNAFGLKVAATTFFGKDQANLYPHEAAMLVGLLKAPTQFSPIIHPEASRARRNDVLGQMKKYDRISELQYQADTAKGLLLSYNVENHNDGIATYFRSVAGLHLRAWCKEHDIDLYADGLKIYTTIDSRMQKYAEEAVQEHMSLIQSKFFKHWEGKNPWGKQDWKKLVGHKDFLKWAIRNTDSYRYFKKKFNGDAEKIEEALNVKKKMTVFSYRGDIDTLFSTYDSLRYYKHFLQTGFMSMDPSTGDIKAWVGGVNHKYFKYDHVKQGKRQPGSTFKPLVYATILGETGNVYSPCYKVVDAPVTFTMDDGKVWTPENADGKYTGDTLTIRQAMGRSVNSITAYMMKLMGDQTPNKVKDYAESMGIQGPLEAVPAMCLGVFDVSVFEMVGAYGTFVNKGRYTKPHFIDRIEDKHGNVLVQFVPEVKKVFSEELSYTMLYMLRGATEEKKGTGLGLYRYKLLGGGNQIGAKTGTTQNYSDGWFMGVTKDLVSGTWVGADHRSIHFRTMALGQGARMAMPIYGLYMQKVYADSTLGITKGPFDVPKIKNQDGKMEPMELDCRADAKKAAEGKDTEDKNTDIVSEEEIDFEE